MKKTFLLIPFIAFTLTSCGSSKEEAEVAEKAKKDSIALMQDVIAKQEVKKDSIIGVEVATQHRLYKQKLAYLQSEYEKACKKLERVKGHIFLRTKHKKQQEIEEQTKVVNDLKDQIAALNNQNL